MHDDKKAKINVVPPEIRVRISGGALQIKLFLLITTNYIFQ